MYDTPALPSFNLNAIDKNFVMAKYRDGQKETIEFALNAFNSGKKIVILECPTGSGKSAIGMTIANMVQTSYYLTITKILQDQLVNDFDELIELKGRNAYPCTFYDRFGKDFVNRKLWSQSDLNKIISKDPHCDSGFCRTKLNNTSSNRAKFKCGKCFLKPSLSDIKVSDGELNNLPPGMRYSACPYYEQVYKAIKSSKVVMNFSSFLYQTQMTKRFDEPRDLLILDECLHPYTRVQTESGLIPIGILVNRRINVKVASFNFKTQRIEYKNIMRWLKRSKKLTYKVLVGNCILYPTIDHKIFTPSGKKKLSKLNVGDEVYVRKPEITSDQQQTIEIYDNIETQVYHEVSICKIKSIEPYKETYNYDLEIEDNHNYFAGNTLVSNCHNVEPQLLNFVSFSISDRHLSSHGVFIPELEHAHEYKTWMEDTKIHRILWDCLKQARADENTRLEDELSRVIKKYIMFLSNMESGVEEWVCEYDEKSFKGNSHRTLTLKPVFIQHFANNLLFKYSKRILMMSATILNANVICKSLGIDKEHVATYRTKNRFPKENRPIKLQTVAKMTGGKQRMGEWGHLLVEAVNKTMRIHSGEKGIIHTHNFAIMDLLLSHCADDVTQRLINQRDFKNKKDLLDAHKRSINDSVLIAPAMHEGIDLVDDLSRFQIICKVPYPNCFDDKQLAKRIETDRRYYTWLVALKICQMYGRSIRSKDDHAITYILDESIYKFMRDARTMLPQWFLEAIVESDAY